MKNILKLIALGLIVIVSAGLAFAFKNDTIIEWWVPVVACALPAVPVGYLLRKPLCSIIMNDNRWLGGAAAAIATFVILIGAFYSLNYFITDDDSTRQYDVTIIGKSTAERYRTRRAGRNRVVQGEKYITYTATVRWPDGREKDFPVTAGEYVRLRKGDKVSLTTGTGLFGVPVIKEKKFRFKHKR